MKPNAVRAATCSELLRIEEIEAWLEYRGACEEARAGGEQRYLDVEPWAWAQLQQKLRVISARREHLREEVTA